MYAVVQIGSTIFRSECLTTRSVVCAMAAGAAAARTAAAQATKVSWRMRKYIDFSWSGNIDDAMRRDDAARTRTIVAPMHGGNSRAAGDTIRLGDRSVSSAARGIRWPRPRQGRDLRESAARRS